MHANMLIYLMLFICDFSAGMTEFPCKFPCPWRNKTFDVFENGAVQKKWKFNSDGQNSIYDFTRYLCYQITERFLIMRVTGTRVFQCFSIFYDMASPLRFQLQDSGEKVLQNQIVEFTDLCEICDQGTLYEAVVSGSPYTFTSLFFDASPSSNKDSKGSDTELCVMIDTCRNSPLACNIPSTCTSPRGIPCNMTDIIPKGCPVTTTEPTTLTTEPTTLTTEPTKTQLTETTTEPTTTTNEPAKNTKRRCRKKHHKHTK